MLENDKYNESNRKIKRIKNGYVQKTLERLLYASVPRCTEGRRYRKIYLPVIRKWCNQVLVLCYCERIIFEILITTYINFGSGWKDIFHELSPDIQVHILHRDELRLLWHPVVSKSRLQEEGYCETNGFQGI